MSTPQLSPLTEMPEPQYVMSDEGYRIATYVWGEDDAPTVLVVHGFASSCRDNWVNTGWVRDLLRAGFRVIGVDQRGHGASEKPHEAAAYAMNALVRDLEIVLDTYLIDDAVYLGYSLGARVGWHASVALPNHIRRAVLGGIPDGRPLGRLDLDQARAFVNDGVEVTDKVTLNYITLTERVPGNDLGAVIALAEGMRFGDEDPDLGDPPTQPVLFATGADDAIIDDSRRIAEGVPTGSFFEIPGRHHFNAPGSREFRKRGIAFLLDD
ncbi:MAG: alpha/beta fold hydrolase [Pseudoclavibacter sp.]